MWLGGLRLRAGATVERGRTGGGGVGGELLHKHGKNDHAQADETDAALDGVGDVIVQELVPPVGPAEENLAGEECDARALLRHVYAEFGGFADDVGTDDVLTARGDAQRVSELDIAFEALSRGFFQVLDLVAAFEQA